MITLISPQTYNTLSENKKRDICTGCGTKEFPIPNKILGVDIQEACNIHDYMYHIGETLADKERADSVFLYNMIISINNHNSIKIQQYFQYLIAMYYYKLVVRHGLFFYLRTKNIEDLEI